MAMEVGHDLSALPSEASVAGPGTDPAPRNEGRAASSVDPTGGATTEAGSTSDPWRRTTGRTTAICRIWPHRSTTVSRFCWIICLRYRSRKVSVGLDGACCAGGGLDVDATPALGRRSYSAAAFSDHLTNASIALNEAFCATGGPI